MFDCLIILSIYLPPSLRLTAGVTRWWARRDSAILTETASSMQTACLHLAAGTGENAVTPTTPAPA